MNFQIRFKARLMGLEMKSTIQSMSQSELNIGKGLNISLECGCKKMILNIGMLLGSYSATTKN